MIVIVKVDQTIESLVTRKANDITIEDFLRWVSLNVKLNFVSSSSLWGAALGGLGSQRHGKGWDKPTTGKS